jgi:hypothetical protein
MCSVPAADRSETCLGLGIVVALLRSTSLTTTDLRNLDGTHCDMLPESGNMDVISIAEAASLSPLVDFRFGKRQSRCGATGREERRPDPSYIEQFQRKS